MNEAIIEAATPMREAIRQLLEQTPFFPFRMHMTGRWTHEVRHPGQVKLGPSTATDAASPGSSAR